MLRSRPLNFALSLIAASLTPAAAGDVWAIPGIPVEVGGNPVWGRDEALKRAETQAFSILMQRIIPKSEQAQVPVPPFAVLKGLVRSVDVADEKITSTNYKARLSVAFSRESVRKYVDGTGARMAEVRGAPVVVVPIFDGPAGTQLWATDSVWRQAWGTTIVASMVTDFNLPDQGSVRPDLSVVTQKGASGLLSWARGLGAGDVIVARARLEGGTMRLDAERGTGAAFSAGPIHQRPGESVSGFIGRGALTLALAIDERWKDEIATRGSDAGEAVLVAEANDAAAWGRMRQRLSRAILVSDVQPVSLMGGAISLKAAYRGTQRALAESLAEAGLAVDAEGKLALREGVK